MGRAWIYPLIGTAPLWSLGRKIFSASATLRDQILLPRATPISGSHSPFILGRTRTVAEKEDSLQKKEERREGLVQVKLEDAEGFGETLPPKEKGK